MLAVPSPTLSGELFAAEQDRRRGAEVPLRTTRTGLQMDPHLSLEAWKALGVRIASLSSSTAWWLGDWLAFGQAAYGHRYTEGIELTGLAYQTLRNYAMVARRFEPSRRRDTLTFQHHAEVCALARSDQDFWLDVAAQLHWSKAELRRRVRASRGREPEESMVVLRLAPEDDRIQQWREAARRSDCDLRTWITAALDLAATEALDARRAAMRAG